MGAIRMKKKNLKCDSDTESDDIDNKQELRIRRCCFDFARKSLNRFRINLNDKKLKNKNK